MFLHILYYIFYNHAIFIACKKKLLLQFQRGGHRRSSNARPNSSASPSVSAAPSHAPSPCTDIPSPFPSVAPSIVPSMQDSHVEGEDTREVISPCGDS